MDCSLAVEKLHIPVIYFHGAVFRQVDRTEDETDVHDRPNSGAVWQPADVLQRHSFLVVEGGGEQYKEDVDIPIAESVENGVKSRGNCIMFFLRARKHVYFDRTGRRRYLRNTVQLNFYNFLRYCSRTGKLLDEQRQLLPQELFVESLESQVWHWLLFLSTNGNRAG
jgi:hypothetical protein